ncbi:S1 RNA-binding domain-containing protein [Pseudobacteriovorax antillogorgiicola]|uniref:SSU ribosomal protein S1P n=1 Tax=Pseudobacteriovorax antillogorgiicola TaxID=1513793 RepID=A0A1Y6BNR3_9BACT|nr:S1 RNA-binding domain-containing protein [Pseudobacteriovorax antillogorgiicola]TCS53916.1 SSU ribosomal protein S1P [Pseudobacteriovorax antillogorgiicola]SMF20603.1 SSU ribosomal protein S1P [Pseudobacteriovorax antillogorgiicola]
MRYDEIKWEDDEELESEKKKSSNADQGDSESFADLLAQADGSFERQSIRVGGQVTGIISAINEASESILVEIDPLHTGVIDRQDLLDDEGVLQARAGDKITAYVVSRKGGEVILSTSMSQSSQSLDDLYLAQENELPVQGKVIGENKGGFEVTVLGKRCFCPVSQIDTRFVQSKAEFIGNEYKFLIEKIEEGGRNIVVSRAKLLRREAELKIQELEEQISEDLILNGTVAELRDYGAFIDLGGLDGFLHVSEMSYSRINRASDFLGKGDKVRVKVLKIETVNDKKRISLSMKAVEEDPWSSIREELSDGASYSGKVTKLESFGAFVEIRPGVEGLIHISEMSWEKRVHHPSDIVSVGDQVNVRLLNIDEANKRISLSLKHVDDDPWVKAKELLIEGQSTTGQVISLKGFGAILELGETSVTGLLPMATLKKAYGESYRKQASPPKQLEVLIRSVNADEKKVLLSLPNIEDDEEPDTSYQDYLAKQESQVKEKSSQNQGTFGALLAAKLNEKKKG